MKMLLSGPILCQQGRCAKESSVNDKNDWKTVSNAFSVIDFTKDDLEVWAPQGWSSLWSDLGLRKPSWFIGDDTELPEGANKDTG